MTLIAVIYGYAHVSKADDKSKNLDTQLGLLASMASETTCCIPTWPADANCSVPAGRS